MEQTVKTPPITRKELKKVAKLEPKPTNCGQEYVEPIVRERHLDNQAIAIAKKAIASCCFDWDNKKIIQLKMLASNYYPGG
jgi:hypothetical protein